jgi:hypothetical protein
VEEIMKKLLLVSLALAFVSSFASSARADHSCDALVNNMKEGGTYTPMTYTVSEGNAGWVGFVSGGFVEPNASGTVGTANHQFQYFSDRRWNATTGGHSYSYLPFNPGAADQITFSFTPSNDILMTLNTWGNTSYTIPVTCHGRFAIGISTSGATSYTHVFSFGFTSPVPG